MLQSLWIQTEDAFATWICDLSLVRDNPDAVARTFFGILALGEAQELNVARTVPALGLSRGKTPGIADTLRARWQADDVIDLPALDSADAVFEAALCLLDTSGHPMKMPVTDLGAELRAREPFPEAIPPSCMCSFPPVRVLGLRHTRETLTQRRHLPPTMRLAIHSDIWLPFVFGGAHPSMDGIRLFDNRPLATCHTPRLNTWIAAAAALTHDAGGSWRLVLDESTPVARPWLTEHGIALDGPIPDLMPASALTVPWT